MQIFVGKLNCMPSLNKYRIGVPIYIYIKIFIYIYLDILFSLNTVG